jgi:histidinol dehydrogenase
VKPSIPIIHLGSPKGTRLLNAVKSARMRRDERSFRTVEKIIADVRKKGDSALFAYTKKFDNVSISARTIRIQPSEIAAQARKAPAAFKTALSEAAKRIVAFHSKQKSAAFRIATKEGTLSQLVRPLARVGVYVPGGYTIYPSSVLMDILPARIAGVAQIAVVTPPRGGLDPKVAFALDLLDVKEAYRVGGAQAIAALAYGTKSIAPVDKIVGPGNSYVALAKKAVYGIVDIDTIAGPSEVVILADSSANPEWVALDLLAQAEHGSGNESAFCVTEDAVVATRIGACVAKEMAQSPVRAVFHRLKTTAVCIWIAQNRDESIKFINEWSPEHLQIITKDPAKVCERIKNAAAIFCGPHTPVALGDYFIGTNHVLPTGGAARYGSPLGVESFIKRISVAEISAKGLRKCAGNVSLLARAENFVHHALSVERRVGIKHSA